MLLSMYFPLRANLFTVIPYTEVVRNCEWFQILGSQEVTLPTKNNLVGAIMAKLLQQTYCFVVMYAVVVNVLSSKCKTLHCHSKYRDSQEL
jgi:hypothetical protein